MATSVRNQRILDKFAHLIKDNWIIASTEIITGVQTAIELERDSAQKAKQAQGRNQHLHTHAHAPYSATAAAAAVELSSADGRCASESETTLQCQRQLSSVAAAAVLVVVTALPTRKFYRKMCRRWRRQVSFETHTRRHTHTHTHELWQLQRSHYVCVCLCECIYALFLLYAAKFIKSKRSSCRNSKTPTTTTPTLVPAESLWEWWTPHTGNAAAVRVYVRVSVCCGGCALFGPLSWTRLGDTPWTFELNILVAKNIRKSIA